MRLHPLPLFLAVFLAAGCGGSSNGSSPRARGTARLRVLWPARARAIPLAANALDVALSLDGKSVATRLVARPTTDPAVSEVVFEDLPTGTLSVSIRAFPNADGTGVAQAVGASALVVVDGAASSVTVTLDTTVRTLELVPSRTSLPRNQTLTVTPSAKDADGNLVLLAVGGASERIAWSVDAPAVLGLTGDANGVATYRSLAFGTTTVRASLTVGESGTPLTASLPVRVSGNTGTVIIQ